MDMLRTADALPRDPRAATGDRPLYNGGSAPYDGMPSPGPRSDRQPSTRARLAAQIKTCDPAVWNALVWYFGPLVLSWALRFGLQREEAADTVQEVYLALLEHIAGLDEKTPDANVLGWLKTVTRNRVCDHFRAHPVEEQIRGHVTNPGTRYWLFTKRMEFNGNE